MPSGGKVWRHYRPQGLSTPQPSRSASFASTFISLCFCPHPSLPRDPELGQSKRRAPDPGPGDPPSPQASVRPSRASALSPGALDRATLTRGSSSSILGGEGRGRWPLPRTGFGARAGPRWSLRSSASGQRKPAPPLLRAGIELGQAGESNCTRLSPLPHLTDLKCGTSKISRAKASFCSSPLRGSREAAFRTARSSSSANQQPLGRDFRCRRRGGIAVFGLEERLSLCLVGIVANVLRVPSQ